MPTPYLAPTLKDQGYTGATGTTPFKPATTQQVDTLQSLYNNSPAANAPQVVSATATVININFDGTRNNGEFSAPGESSTNIAKLSNLQKETNGVDKTIYLPGVGAQTVPTGTLDGMMGDGKSAPPPPAGIVHFSWDADGQIQHTIDHNQSGGRAAANQAAASVQALLENVVQAVDEANAQKTGDHSQDVAINPYLLPRIHYGSGGACMEVTQFDGSTTLEGIGQDGFAERLISILQDNGGLAPAWQVATVQGHWAQAQEELADLRAQLSEAQPSVSPQAAQIQQQINTRQQALDHELHAGIGGHAYAGNEAYSLQGNAAESADFKTQDFGVLVVHIPPHVVQNPGVQASAQALDQTLENIQKQALKLSETLRDVENDGYAERTDWISATDGAGNLQGLLVLDQNGNGLIETRDILNLGGNAEPVGNATDEASGSQPVLSPNIVAHVNRSEKLRLFRARRKKLDCDKPTDYFKSLAVDGRMAVNASSFLAYA